MQIIGFCRFSFFGPSDTKLSYADRDAAFASLYDPARMATRFHLFENLLLPSLAAQTDPDFRLVVLSSQIMPERYRQRLTALCAPVPQIELVISETDRIKPELLRHTQERALAKGGLMQFRIDDDDALSRNYIARLRQWAPTLRDEMILTLPKGLMLYQDQGIGRLYPMYRNLTGAGYAFRTEGPTRRTVFSVAHLKSGRRFAYVSDPTMFCYVQSFSKRSDTGHRAPRKIREFQKNAGVANEAEAELRVSRALADDFSAFRKSDLLRLLDDPGSMAG